MRALDAYSLDCIKRWEGLRLVAYLDSAGVWTIGYGHTGPDVSPGATWTPMQADAALLTDLQACCNTVSALCSVPLTDGQFGALVSFVFNVGAEAFRRSTLLRRLNAGSYDAVPAELARWNKITVNGKAQVLPGLTNRRAAEAGLWARGDHVSTNTVIAEPPQEPAPMYRRPEGIGMGTTGIGAAGAALQSTASSLQVTGANSPLITILVVVLILAGVGLTVYGLIRSAKA